MIRYRSGVDAVTGKIITGFAHVEQSISKIIMTRFTERVMLLDFGSDIFRHLGRNMTPLLALELYRDLVIAVHRWEPEYRVRTIQLVSIERTGGFGIGMRGTYFPEGRLGNYEISEPASGTFPITTAAAGGSV